MSGKPSKSKGTTKTLVVSRRERTNEEEEQINQHGKRRSSTLVRIKSYIEYKIRREIGHQVMVNCRC